MRILNEDKTVNFNGKPFPRDGWCVIVCGGPGMGKSTAINNIINIDAKHLDVDEVKTMWLSGSEIYGDKLITASGKEYNLDEYGIDEPYDFSNAKFTSFVHEVTKPLARKRKEYFVKAAGTASGGRLPNVIFDITGDEISKFMDIISVAKEIGYKISVVYVAGKITQALAQNERRARRVDKEIVLSKHRDVIGTVIKLYNSNLMDEVDEFYVIVQYDIDMRTREGKLEYIKKDNVYKLKEFDGTITPRKEIFDMLEQERDVIQNMME